MPEVCSLIWLALVGAFRSRISLEAENTILRHRCRVQRAPPPSPTAVVHEILQWGPHASIPGERCPGLARRRSRRAHSLSPNPGRTTPPICPDLIYDRHSRIQLDYRLTLLCHGACLTLWSCVKPREVL